MTDYFRGIARSHQALRVNGVELCVERIGRPDDPAILLIAGSGSSMDWWEDGFCERLAAGGRLVVRYDHRDTGESVSYPPGAPGYASEDLLADVLGVLDALGIARAHLAGISMGAGMAQVVALDHPARVASLTLISTSPAGPGEPDLPDMSAQARAALMELEEPDWSDRAAVIEHLVAFSRLLASPSVPFDEAALRALAERVVDRTTDMRATMTNHNVLKVGSRWRERLGQLRVPTLVLHGTEDPLFPLGHGEALAREIPGARLIALERTGHELPARTWDVVVPAILEHTAGR